MLNLSNSTIVLNKSSDYLRLSSLIYGCALVLAYCSAIPFILKSFILGSLLMQMIALFKVPFPHPQYSRIVYTQSKWLLIDHNNHQVNYDRNRILIRVGLFFLLELQSIEKEKGRIQKRKLLVIFVDQITSEQYRFLNILEKIN